MKNNRTEQELFWSEQYAKDYIDKNSEFDLGKGVQAWNHMLAKTHEVSSILECGCNIGRNIEFLNYAFPNLKKSIIEVSSPAYSTVTNKYNLDQSFNGTIMESNFREKTFDLVFSMGVLIHIQPGMLLQNIEKMFLYTKKYILIGEYFSREPVMLQYQGEDNKLFKRDFGKLLMDNFPLNIVDYGFLWGYEYDNAGFDDITWWLFEKQ